MNFQFWLYLIFFGIVGVVSRTAINLTLGQQLAPWGTLFINVAGSLIIGVVYAKTMDESLKLAMMMGFLGAFTTFSGFSLDIMKWVIGGQIKVAVIYFFLTNFACLGACYLGYKASI